MFGQGLTGRARQVQSPDALELGARSGGSREQEPDHSLRGLGPGSSAVVPNVQRGDGLNEPLACKVLAGSPV